MQRWFDGHLDLAYLAAHGRDLTLTADRCGGDGGGGGLQPAAVTFPALRDGNVCAAFATIFIQRRVTQEQAHRENIEPLDGPWCFDSPEEAYTACLRQFAQYELWDTAGEIHLVTSPLPPDSAKSFLEVMLLLEGAAAVRSVRDFQEFYDAGVRIVALTWNEGTIWAGGDRSGGNVTIAGRELIAEVDRLHCVHDVSHLSEAAFWTLMECAKGLKIASHSNCRALLPGKKFPERNLSDEQIRALADAGGIIGINLFSPFLLASNGTPAQRAGIEHVLQHIKHIEDVTGRRECLALGSDFDGGYPRTSWAQNLDGPELLPRLADALADANWTTQEIDRFAWQNWAKLLENFRPI